MVPLVGTSPDWGEQVRGSDEEELWNVEHVDELGSISDVEPHPVSVRLQADGLDTEELEEI